MARKKTSKKRRSAKNPEHAERNKRIAITSAVVLAAASAFVATAMGVGELNERAAEFVVPTNPEVVIQWATNPDGRIWMPIKEREHLEQLLARSVKGTKALSQVPLEEAGRALMGTGWIIDTPTVRWTSEGKISVEANWRRPVAAIRNGTREYIIDSDRFVLPLDYAIGESNQFFLVNASGPMPKAGKQWQGTDLEDGLSLLIKLREYALLEQVAGIDLGAGAGSGTLTIITIRDARIIWGAGPGRERPGEEPTGRKIERLQALQEKTGLIDGGASLVDIRGASILLQRREG